MSKPSDTQWGSGYNYSQVGFSPKTENIQRCTFMIFPVYVPATECRINIQRMKDAQCIGNLGANFLGQPVE